MYGELVGTKEDWNNGVKQYAGRCHGGCIECRWSWPKDDQLKWKSDDLMARCMPNGMQPYKVAN